MASTSADRAFGIIALEKKLLTKEALAAAERQLEEKHATGEALLLAELLVSLGTIDAAKRADLERIRAKHGRTCEKCEKTTFLLPGESVLKKPCEHCSGKLRPTTPPAAAPAAPAAPLVVKPLTRKIERSISRAPAPAPAAEETKPEDAAAPRATDSRGEVPAFPPKTPEEAAEDARRNERAKKLRMAGAFGYEGPDAPKPEAPKPAPPAGVEPPITADDLAPPAEAPPAKPPLPDSAFLPPPEPAPSADDDPAPAFSRPKGFGIAGVAPPQPSEEAAPFTSYTDEAKLILTYPIRGGALPLITIGAVIGGVIAFVSHIAGPFGFFLYAFLLLYFYAFQVKVANHVTAGHAGVPDWPEPGEVSGLGWRILLCNVACILPAIACIALPFLLPAGSAKPALERIKGKTTVGDDAHELAGSGAKVVGNDVSEEEFVDKHELPVKLSEFKGKWLVLGLIDKDDTTDTAIHRGLATPEIYDLDRLGRAVPEVNVVGVIIDPGERRFKALGIIHDDLPPLPPEKEGDEETGERTKLPPEINADPFHKKLGPVADELERLRIIRTVDFWMPDRFNKCNTYPTVWIIDQTGKIRKQYDGGASDHKLYATLEDLMKGGSGDGVNPRSLPGEKTGGVSLGLSPGFWGFVVLLAYLAGAFYHPMAFLMTVVFTNGLLSFNYPAGVGAISRTQRDYFHLVGVLIAGWVVCLFLRWFLGDVALLHFPAGLRAVGSSVASWWVLLYSLLVEAFALGRFYLRNKQALGWFS